MEAPGDHEEEFLQPETSLNSVMGLTNPKTIMMMGHINGEEVVVMIDPGATHNFISTTTVEKLLMSVTPSKAFGVSLGTGELVQGEEICQGVPLYLQGIEMVEDLFSLPLGNSDLILGIQWLEKLGTMTTNWKTQTPKFMLNGEAVTLMGDPSLGRPLVSLKAMIRTLIKDGRGFLIEFNHLEGQREHNTIHRVRHPPIVPPSLEQC